MSIAQIKIVNCETGEEIVRDMNDEELTQMNIDKKNAEEEKKAALAKKQARELAEEKLSILGLTIDDLRALGLA